MGEPGVWAKLAGSAFLADVADRDREPARLATTLVGGFCLALVAAIACLALIFSAYTVLAGWGAQGLGGLGRTAALFRDPNAHGFGAMLLQSLGLTGINGVVWLAFVIFAAILAGYPLHTYLTVAAKVRWRLLALGLGLSVLALSPIIAVDRWLGPGGAATPIVDISRDWPGRLVYGLAALLLIPAAASEELMFRGWLLRQMAAFTRRPVILVFVTALVFAAVHLDFEPEAFVNRVLMGAGFAYMTLRLGGIELSTGAHAANNILIVLFIGPLPAQTVAGPSNLTVAVVGDIALVAGYVLITEAVARIAGLRRWAGVKAEEISGPALRAAPLI